MPRVARLRIYPIKSCRGYDIPTADLDELGMAGDRRVQVVDATGKPFTQRSHPALARVNARLDTDQIRIDAPDVGSVTLPLAPTADSSSITTEVWSTTGLQADTTSPEADQFFSELLKTPALLIRTGVRFNRPVEHHPDARVGFADAYPLLVISEASLADLNDRLIIKGEMPISMERFRPNIVATDCQPFDEDRWIRIQIADTNLQTAGPCERCIMTTVHPESGENLGPEPLRTLASYRRDPAGSGINFGQNLVHLTNSGTLTVGDNVKIIT